MLVYVSFRLLLPLFGCVFIGVTANCDISDGVNIAVVVSCIVVGCCMWLYVLLLLYTVTILLPSV